MRYRYAILFSAAFWILPLQAGAQSIAYPVVRRDSVVDTYFGRRVPDPYRWLETLDSPETHAWVEAQNTLTRGYLDSLPSGEWFRRRLTALWDFPEADLPERAGERLFYRKNSGLQRQSVLYVRAVGRRQDRTVLDANRLSEEGSIALMHYEPSADGRRVAYGLSEGGSDLQTWYVRDTDSDRAPSDTVRNVKFSSAQWTHDGRGFFYARYPDPEAGKELSEAGEYHRIYYHVLGTPQREDRLIYEDRERPTWIHLPFVSDDGRYLGVYVGDRVGKNRLYILDLGDPRRPRIAAPMFKLIDEDDADFVPVGTIGDTLFLRTDLNAPNRRIVAITLPDTARARWREVVPAGEHPIEGATIAGGRIVVHRLVDVRSRLDVYRVDGKHQQTLTLPDVGAVLGIAARADSPELFYQFTSPLQPPGIFRVDVRSGQTRPFVVANSPLSPKRYETRQVFFTSKDGSRVPMFITMRRGLALDGSHSVLLHGYGGFQYSNPPRFRITAAAWLEAGGIYALANIRGGSEYGEAWHQAGMRERKQNVFDDFIAAAEHLVAAGYTRSGKIAMEGGSNGGLLVGAIMTQRPEVLGAALPAVGVHDMLRYQKFTAGAFWVDEYGASDDSTAVGYLLEYSPLHNVRPGTCYPPTLLTTADYDDRVVPSHTYKFASALQAAQGCAKPILVRVETVGSHGYQPKDRAIAEVADILSFAAHSTGLQVQSAAAARPAE